MVYKDPRNHQNWGHVLSSDCNPTRVYGPQGCLSFVERMAKGVVAARGVLWKGRQKRLHSPQKHGTGKGRPLKRTVVYAGPLFRFHVCFHGILRYPLLHYPVPDPKYGPDFALIKPHLGRVSGWGWYRGGYLSRSLL